MNQFILKLLGNTDPIDVLVALCYAIFTAGAVFLWRVATRDPMDDESPVKTDWKFYRKQKKNISRILATVIFIFITIILSLLYLPNKYLIHSAVAIGLLAERLAMLFLLVGSELDKLIKIKITKTSGDAESKIKNDKNENV